MHSFNFNPFTKIVSGLKWVATELKDVVTYLPKIIVASKDIASDASDLVPNLAILIGDCDALVLAGVKDGGVAVELLAKLVASIATAVSADCLNPASDTAVVASFDAFVTTVGSSKNFQDVLTAYAQLVKDYDVVKNIVNRDIAQIEHDIAVA